MKKKKGFTLIELLVVVIIIGILAAIALPMYTRAVEKSRLSEAVSTAASIEKAMDRFILANGMPTGGIEGKAFVDLLDIDVPAGGEWSSNGLYYCTKNYWYFFVCEPWNMSSYCSVQINNRLSGSSCESPIPGDYVLETTIFGSVEDAVYTVNKKAQGNKYRNCNSTERKYDHLCLSLLKSGYTSENAP